MRYNYIFFVVLIPLLLSCKDEFVPEPYMPRSEHDAYRYSLQQADLLESALGKDWISISEYVLNNPVPIEPPYKEAFYLDPSKADAIGYRFSVQRGQKIEAELTVFSQRSIQLFIDLYRIDNDSLNLLTHVASADSIYHNLAFEPRRNAEYILRLQPELLRGGRFGIAIRKVPSFNFPVTGKDSRAIGSYFGDPRDGGKREHHGVDIFAKRHTPIIAPTRAYVRRVGERGLGGNVIWLRDSKGYNLYFAHLQEQWVQPHTYVNPGDTIGTVGNTGNARTTPPHLHFGIYSRGPIDPIHFIKETDINLPDIHSDIKTPGSWIRTHKRSYVKSIDSAIATLDTLDPQEPIKVLAAVEAKYRVMTPKGRIGYIDFADTESTIEPLSHHAVSDSHVLLNTPDTNAVAKENLRSGETLSILAKHKDYWFVRTSMGDLGWVNNFLEINTPLTK